MTWEACNYTHCWYYAMWVQISGHSSVNHLTHSDHERHASQSTSSGLRRLNRGNCCTPKFALPYSSRFAKSMLQNLPKGCTVQRPPNSQKLGFWFWQRNWSFQGSNQVPHAYKHGQASSYQVSRLTAQNCTVKNPNCTTVNCRGKMVIWQSKVQIFGQHLILKPQTSFDQFLIMILKAWLKKSQDAKVSIFGQLKKSTANWPKHNFHMVYQKNSIQSSFWREGHFLKLIFILQVQEILSQKVINFNIIGHFQKSTKRDFKSKAITWDW